MTPQRPPRRSEPIERAARPAPQERAQRAPRTESARKPAPRERAAQRAAQRRPSAVARPASLSPTGPGGGGDPTPPHGARWYRMLASWYTGSGGGSCGTLQNGRLHFAELGVAGDYGHGVGRGRGNMAIDLGMSGQLHCGAGGWIRYRGRTAWATKADIGYGNTSLPPNARNQRRIDLYVNLAHRLGFGGVDYIEFSPGFRAHTGGGSSPTPRIEWVNMFAHARVRGERIDQGVDYAGTGYLVSPTHAIVTEVATGGNTGWPGNFVEFQITTPGQLNGAYIYFAEGVTPNVHRGEVLAPGQKVATLIPGWHTGIECGFGGGEGTITWYGRHEGRYDGRSCTRAGLAFDVLVRRLGGPSGIIEANVVGSYPPFLKGGQLDGQINPQTLGGVTPANSLGPVMQHETALSVDWGYLVKKNWRNIDTGAKAGAGYAGAAWQNALHRKYLTKAR